MANCIPTLNHFGYQASLPTELFPNWLQCYDGKNPLLDIGCAFGISTLKALELGIHTIAMDPEVRHLDVLRSQNATGHSHVLTCVIGSLPDNVPCPDNYFSGILCSEVLHFLLGTEVEKAFRVLHRKLIVGGKLFIIAMSHWYLDKISPLRERKFQEDLEAGVKWPGEIYIDDDFLSKYEDLTLDEGVRMTLRQQHPVSSLLHFFTIEQLEEELKRSGFFVEQAYHGAQPGIDTHGMGKVPGLEILIIARKL